MAKKRKTNLVVFLDFDGVVNTIIWRRDYKVAKGKLIAGFAHPFDGFVNNYQAICWLNELYKKYPFDIVVTSTWRELEGSHTVKECLQNGGLNKKIKISKIDPGINRPKLINKWIKDNNYKGEYIIFDDEDYYTVNGIREYTPINCEEMTKRFIKTDPDIGITPIDYNRAEFLCESLLKKTANKPSSK